MEKVEGMDVVSEESAGAELLIAWGRRSPEYASIDVLEEVAQERGEREKVGRVRVSLIPCWNGQNGIHGFIGWSRLHI
jgi:hypothetical protein